MELTDLINLPENKKILILGVGKENRQFLDWLEKVLKFDLKKVVLADKKAPANRIQSVDEEQQYYGENYLEQLKNPDICFVFKAPGIWSLLPELEDFRNVHGQDSVNSSLIFFWKKYRQQIIAVTGTKGKSTVSSLVNHIINSVSQKLDQQNKITSVYCGNTTGISPYTFWTKIDAEIDTHKYFVVETSSFQLEDLGHSQISPKYGIITNYYIDHLDQHKDKQEYWASKDNIFKYQEIKDWLVTSVQVLEKTQFPDILKTKTLLDTHSIELIHDVFKTHLVGYHNLVNVSMALTMVGGLLGKSTSFLEALDYLKTHQQGFQDAIYSYQALPHRMQNVADYTTLVRVQDHIIPVQISFIDDGYATEPDAVSAAIKSGLERKNNYIWLQVAGVDKGSDLNELANSINQAEELSQLIRVDYCGKVGYRIGQTAGFLGKSSAHTPGDTFKKAVAFLLAPTNIETVISQFLEGKDTLPEIITVWIIFSPSGSSFDEFENVGHRADWWTAEVKNFVAHRLAEQEINLV